jgi:hypothetical protein
VLLIVLGCAVFLAVPGAAATAKQDAATELIAALDTDELARATIARQIGDAVVLDALRHSDDPATRLAAVRLAPYLRDPDRALSMLAEIASGRDPELAPAAGLRLLQIAQELLLAGALLEGSPEGLRAALRAMVELSADPAAPDRLRLVAGQAAYLLGRLAVAAEALGRSG